MNLKGVKNCFFSATRSRPRGYQPQNKPGTNLLPEPVQDLPVYYSTKSLHASINKSITAAFSN
jgi:hypothetical protein